MNPHMNLIGVSQHWQGTTVRTSPAKPGACKKSVCLQCTKSAKFVSCLYVCVMSFSLYALCLFLCVFLFVSLCVL